MSSPSTTKRHYCTEVCPKSPFPRRSELLVARPNFGGSPSVLELMPENAEGKDFLDTPPYSMREVMLHCLGARPNWVVT
jgi:hypothetical protein